MRSLNLFFLYFSTIFLGALAHSSTVLSASWEDDLQFNGFYSIDSTVTNTDAPLLSNATFIRQYESGKPSLENSLIGAQLEYALTSDISAVLQGKLFAKAGNQNGIDNSIDWAYLRYDVGNDYQFRIGKFLIPVTQSIEMKNIGYSRLWVRPFVPNSGAGGYKDYLGAELIKNLPTNYGSWTIQGAIGQAEHDLEEIDNKHLALLSVQFSRNDYWLRSSILRTEYTVETPRGDTITDSGHAFMGSMEAEYSPDPFIVNAGFTAANADITPNDSLIYLSLAFQYDNFTPFLSGSKRGQHFDTYTLPTPSQPLVGAPGANTPTPPAPPEGDHSIYNFGAGVRWDFSEQHALKVQLNKTKQRDKSKAASNTSPDSIDGTIFTIVLEGVF